MEKTSLVNYTDIWDLSPLCSLDLGEGLKQSGIKLKITLMRGYAIEQFAQTFAIFLVRQLIQKKVGDNYQL